MGEGSLILIAVISLAGVIYISLLIWIVRGSKVIEHEPWEVGGHKFRL